MKIKLSKSQWEMIGRKTGWMNKKAQGNLEMLDQTDDSIADENRKRPEFPKGSILEVKNQRQMLINKLKQDLKMNGVKPGNEFEQDENCLLWSGELSTLVTKDGKRMEAFDSYAHSQDSDYINGIHKDLVEWSEKMGIEWQPYDAGTWLGYKS